MSEYPPSACTPYLINIRKKQGRARQRLDNHLFRALPCHLIERRFIVKTIIISAFPGTGKTHFCKNTELSCIDSDSSNFSWLKDSSGNNTEERNPFFPENYIQHIKDNIGKVDVILVSSHLEVRNALSDAMIQFYFFYPPSKEKDKYIERFKERGSPQSFIDRIEREWDNWQYEMVGFNRCFRRVMSEDYLSEEIRRLTASEEQSRIG